MTRLRFCLPAILACVSAIAEASNATADEVVVLGGIDEAIGWLKSEDWWGEDNQESQLTVPRIVLTGINPQWRKTAQALTVPEKKQIFYRFMLPLIMHANSLVLSRRARATAIRERLVDGQPVSLEDREFLLRAATLLRVRKSEELTHVNEQELIAIIDQLLYRLDLIPPGLALGQAAYESGYGTSRFAIEGNAFIGQWTYGGQGLVPEQQRRSLGDHRIAAYDWPFDSVRGYYLNLSSHPAYEPFRRLRADLRQRGEPFDSLVLADGLISYSERGQGYVDTLKGIIRVNRLNIADDAVSAEEPLRFIVGAPDESMAAKLRQDIAAMRESGALSQIVERMDLE
jgi:uncharacterized FlgJ-related protein